MENEDGAWEGKWPGGDGVDKGLLVIVETLAVDVGRLKCVHAAQ